MTLHPYLVLFPRAVILVCSERDLHFFVWMRDFNKKHGPYAAKKRGIPTFTALQFNYGWQGVAVRPSAHDRLSISSRALMQLLLWYGRTNDNEFTDRDLRHFFEGNELNSAERYLEHVALPILQGSPLKLGSVQRYSVDRDRAMWRQLLQ